MRFFALDFSSQLWRKERFPPSLIISCVCVHCLRPRNFRIWTIKSGAPRKWKQLCASGFFFCLLIFHLFCLYRMQWKQTTSYLVWQNKRIARHPAPFRNANCDWRTLFWLGEGIEAAESLTNSILNIKPFHLQYFWVVLLGGGFGGEY